MPQVRYILRTTITQSAEALQMDDVDPDEAMQAILDKIPAMKSDDEALVASKADAKKMINGPIMAMARQHRGQESSSGSVQEEAAVAKVVNRSIRSYAARSRRGAALRQDPGFGGGPSRTAKKRR